MPEPSDPHAPLHCTTSQVTRRDPRPSGDPVAAPPDQAPFPSDPIAAVTHRDPYPYYARLVAERPLYFDPGLGLWVASSAEAVSAVLASEICRVRPPAEPVPAAIVGTPAGEVFRRLVRMNDGGGHGPMKQAVSAALASIDGRRAAEVSREWARALVAETRPHLAADRLHELAFRLPVYAVASLLGVGRERLADAAAWTGDLAACFAPAATRVQSARGGAAAAELIDLFRSLDLFRSIPGALASGPPTAPAGGLLAALSRQAERAGCADRDTVVANGIGFLFQAFDATAGLIGNTLVSLGRHREARAGASADRGRLGEVIAEVLRHDPPVQNTRRFVAADGTVAGREMRAGDAVLVVLAAANRDPAAHPDPDRFDPARRDRGQASFGAGVHLCPGQALAKTIAQAGVEQLLQAGIDLDPLARPAAYRASANVRIPLFDAGGGTRPRTR